MIRLIAAKARKLGTIFASDSEPRRLILTAALICAAYYLGALFSFALRVPSTRSSIIWAPNAVLLAVLVKTPPRTWWIWLVAALPAHLLAQARDVAPILLLLCPFFANVAQALLAALGMRRFMNSPTRLETLRDMAVFILVAVLIVPGLVSFACAWMFVAVGWESDYWTVALARFLNNIVTGLSVAPLCLAIAGGALTKLRRQQIWRYAEFAAVLLGLASVLSIASGWQATESITFPTRLHASLLFLIWAAVRFSPAGLSIALLIVAYDSISDSIAGQGLFADGTPVINVLALEASLAVLSFPLMLLSALIQERNAKEHALGESEARYRALASASSEIVWRANASGEGLFATPAWQELTGQREEQSRNWGWLDAVHPDDRERCRRLWHQAMAQRHTYQNELRVRSLDETYRHFYVHAVPILSPDGGICEWIGAVRDITGRKRAEQTLRESEARFRNMAEHAPLMIWISDPDGSCAYVNKRYADFAGGEPEAAPDFAWIGSDDTDERERIIAKLLAAHARHEAFRVEYRMRRYDGADRWVIDSASPRFSEGGAFLGYIGSIIDITERKRAEEALRQSEERLARTEKFSLVMVTHTDLDGRWIKIPPTLCALLRYSEEELLGRRFIDLTHPEDVPLSLRERARLLAGEIKSFDLEKRFICKDGKIVWVYINVSVVMDEHGMPIHCLAYVKDISGRKRALDVLHESEERLQLALEAGGMGIWDLDKRSNALSWSKEAFTIMGLEPFGIAPTLELWAERVHPDDLPSAMAAIEGAIGARSQFRNEYRIITDSAQRWVVSRGKPIYDENGQCVRVMGAIVDITERKQAEEALRHALAEVKRLKERAEADNRYLQKELSEAHRDGQIVGKSEAIRSVLNQAAQVAATDTTVLILGETGTGKELVARAIYTGSARNQRPLIKVNCSALPAELMEAELFGHERGAFTGALAKRIGRFELADGGTIFLDEIGDLPLSLQAKLLRVLQEGEFERLGSSKTMRGNVRVIAATNRDLSEAIRKGEFRADLYYRLAVYPISIPPLRERKEDIELLAVSFLKEASRRLGRSFEGMPRRVLKALEHYDWPGNIRELQNVIERAAVTCTGQVFQLPEEWHEAVRRKENFAQNGLLDSISDPVGFTLDGLERAHIIHILNRTHWRIEGPKGAAVMLGLRPSTLRSRMRKFAISRKTDLACLID